jgi:hypothetical protein
MSDGIDERDRLTFWRNWYEAIRFKPEKERLEKYDALLAYVFDGVEPEKPTAEHPETANAYEIVNFVRATVAKSRAQRANGSKPKAKKKPKRSQAEANAKPKKAKARQEQEQEQVQEQEQEHNANSITATRTREAAARYSLEQFIAAGSTAGVPADFCRERWLDLEARGWIDENGRRTLTSPRSYLKTAWTAEQKKIRAARVSGDDQFGGIRVG